MACRWIMRSSILFNWTSQPPQITSSASYTDQVYQDGSAVPPSGCAYAPQQAC